MWRAYASVCAWLFTAILPKMRLFIVSYWVQCGHSPRTGSPRSCSRPLFVYIIRELPMNIGLAGCFGLWLLAV